MRHGFPFGGSTPLFAAIILDIGGFVHHIVYSIYLI